MNPHDHAANDPSIDPVITAIQRYTTPLDTRRRRGHARCYLMGAQPTVRILVALGLALAFSVSAWADFTGKVVAVADGDTLTVLVDRRQVQVDLAEIDAPELKQPFGQRSRQSLADLCFGNDAVVREAGRERNGRTIGHVDCSGTDANTEQVRRGMAWVYRRSAGSTPPLYFLEDEAQRSHEGLWADRSPIAPWIWRKDQRGRRR
jgi:endonuclease YncB( thermonuclease family)